MAGEGYALAREELIRTLTAYSGVTTADGSSDKNTLVDSALIDKNDFLTGKSVLIMSGDAQYETAGITDFDSDTGEITFTPLSAQIVAGVSFRVLNVLPESLHISSGQVQIQGYDYVSGEYRLVAVNESGQIEIKATVADIVTARVSGVVAVVSGEVHVMSGQVDVFMMSGEAVAKISGQSVVVTSGQVVAKISGESVVVTSGQVVAKVSGEAVKISGQSVVVTSGQVVSKISGESVVVTSGQVVAKVSGETIIAKISGETVTAKVSGETVQTAAPSTIRAGYSVITSQSGGTELYSGEVVIAKVVNLSGNAQMWLGPAGVLSGTGLLLFGGEEDEFEIDNLNAIYLYAETSGQYASYRGVN